MCGIAGSINSPLNTEKVFAAMQHRGPDAQTAQLIDNVHLVHVRLAIVDSVGGVQPMSRGNLVVSFNGEIYNHQQLRTDHQLKCATQSDTETLLALFEKYGIDCLRFLDGMFVFAMLDTSSDSLWLARDRAGEKPLYYSANANSLVFASELNALSEAIDTPIDHDAINAFLSTGIMYRNSTPYSNVSELPAGVYLKFNTRSLQHESHRWFAYGQADGNVAAATNNTRVQSIDQIDQLLHESVKNRLLSSDLEVGAFLSGGIDSGLVTAIAAQYTEKLKTFTVSFNGQFDESPLAKLVADKYQTDHQVLQVNYDSLDQNIETILRNYGEPICDDSVIPTWYVSKAAKEHVTVVLTGDGADELFGGYRRYVPYAKLNLFSNAGVASKIAFKFLPLLPMPANKFSKYNYAYRFLDLLRKSGLDRYLSTTINIDSSGLLNPAFSDAMKSDFDNILEKDRSSLFKVMNMDFNTLLFGALLPKMDIGSMAHSLEARAPFLSHHLLDLAPQLDASLKINGRETKSGLRELSQRYLPESVQTAPKRGFETPLVDWVDGILKAPIGDRLSSSSSYVSSFYKAGYIDKLLNNQIAMPAVQRSRLLWAMYCVEVWADGRNV